MKTGQIIRIIFSVVAGLFIVIGICSLIFSFYYFRELRWWYKTPSFDIRVDLSQPGEFSKQFTLKCPYADVHGLYLILPDSFSREYEQKDLFFGLEAHFSFLDYSGAEIEWLRERPLRPNVQLSEGQVDLGQIIGLPKKTKYTFRLKVSQGAKALSGVEQRITMKNFIGFAAMLPVFALWLGIFSLVFGAILALLIRLTRKKSDTHKINQPADISDEPEKV